MLIGEILCFHAKEEMLTNDLPDPRKLDHVARNGGAFYTRAFGDSLFEVAKPAGKPIGYDRLPEVLKASHILSGNDLGRLANTAELPDLDSAEARPGDPSAIDALETAIQVALHREDLSDAWRLVGLRLRS